MKALVIWLIILSYGCSAQSPEAVAGAGGISGIRPGIPLHCSASVSRSFTADERRAIELGLQSWGAATDGMVDVEIAEDAESALMFEDVDLQPASPGELGETSALHGGDRVTIAIDRAWNQVVATWPDTPAYFSVLAFTVRHELGHALGLPHLASGLMAENAHPVDAPIDQLAIDALETLRVMP